MTRPFSVRAVLFDLDGTLADTAPDLGGAVNRMRLRRSLDALPLERLRPVASAGARGMLGVGFGVTPGQDGYDDLRDEFLAEYESALDRDSCLFDGVADLLRALELRGLAWGIVTNKVMRYTRPVVAGLGLARAGVVIAGDSTPHPKPHPAPLRAACTVLGVEPSQAIYVGDDLRDIEAARAAAMPSVAVRYGYLGTAGPVDTWGADAVVDTPLELLGLLRGPAMP